MERGTSRLIRLGRLLCFAMADSMEPERSVEPLEVGFEVTDIEFRVTVQHGLDFRITSDVLGHNRDATFRQVLDAGSDVDRRAEIV